MIDQQFTIASKLLEARRRYEAGIRILKEHCHSGTNARTHDAIYRALIAFGERPEAKEERK